MGATKRMGSKIYLVLAFLALAGVNAAVAQPIVSSFDASAEGWTVSGNPGPPASTVPDWNAAGGNPGGYISDFDEGAGGMFFDAPAAFLGDQSSKYGEYLSWDRITDMVASPVVGAEHITLVGAAETLEYTGPSAPGSTGVWDTSITSSPIILDETDTGWTKLSNGANPTGAEFLAVLTTLSALTLRVDNDFGFEVGGIDNVVMTPVELQSFAIE